VQAPFVLNSGCGVRMSVINDVLDRVEEVDDGTTSLSISNLELRPLDLMRPGKRGARLTFPSLVYAFVLFTFLVLGVLFLRALNNRIHARATTPASAEAVVAATPESAAPAPLNVAGPTPIAPAAGAAAPPPETAVPGAPAAVSETAPPELVPLRLQAVFYTPSRPSAIVSGQTVFVGDRIRGFRVTQIRQNSATLVGDDQTIELKLN
jgi:hypothetical protein